MCLACEKIEGEVMEIHERLGFIKLSRLQFDGSKVDLFVRPVDIITVSPPNPVAHERDTHLLIRGFGSMMVKETPEEVLELMSPERLQAQVRN